jgi:long-chain acyl-CoA synthetase
MNLAHLLDPHPHDAPALIDDTGRVTSYGDLRDQVGRMRARLVAAGVKPDDRVALLSANDVAFVTGYLAVLGVGAIAVPLNPASPPAELGRELGRVRVSLVIAGPGGGHAGAGLDQADFADVPVLAPSPNPDAPDSDGQEEHDPQPPPIVEREPDDLAALLFTAGTGGSPRPAMLTHNNLLANIDQLERHPGRILTDQDVVFGVLPLFHIFGLNVLLGGSLKVGAPILLLDRFDAETAIELIARHQVTILLGAPTMYAALAALPDEPDQRRRLDSTRLAFSGAAPLSAEVAEACERRFGLVIRQGYGLTEAAPVVTSSVVAEPPRRGSIGVPIPGVDVRLVDDEGEEALDGDPGEIWVRGANVFPGYWEDPEATARVLTPDGWLKTGDVAVAGDDGELYIVDRAKDVIIVSGFNVFPAEVEDVLLEYPGVAEVAVVGEADPYRGEVIRAFVVPVDPRAQTVTVTDLMAFAAGRLARYKCPAEISLVPSLPHGLGGKLLRRALRTGTFG